MSPVVLHATNTHLYRGARLESPAGFPADPGPVRILFRDGMESDAELVPGQEDGELTLDVPGHRTAAGQDIPAKSWKIARIESGPAAETAIVGERLS